MIRSTLDKAVALLGLAGILAAPCCARTVFLDTIGDGTSYQVGKELTRKVSVGYDSHPLSGDFTGVRPTFAVGGVTELGTSGAPCAQLWVAGAPGVVDPISGTFACWAAQPFTATQSGVVDEVEFIAQIRQSAGYAQGSGRSAYVGIVPADASGNPVWTGWNPVSVDLSTATIGKQVSVSGLNTQLTSGQRYCLVIAPTAQVGAWTANGLDYANVNFAWKSVVAPSSNVMQAMYNHNNANGVFTTLANRVLGVKILGPDQTPVDALLGDARKMADGAYVNIADVVISAKSGAVGPDFFYVQSADRVIGLRVVGTTSLPVGQHVGIVGTVTTVGVERAITLDSISDAGSNDDVAPLHMTNKTLGGADDVPVLGVTGGIGINTVGLLVRVEGNIVSSNGSEFVISDGSTVNGIKCRMASGSTAPSGFATLTGVVTLEETGGVREAVVLVTQ